MHTALHECDGRPTDYARTQQGGHFASWRGGALCLETRGYYHRDLVDQYQGFRVVRTAKQKEKDA